MKKILWLSRHRPLVSQYAELKRLFGEDCEITVDQESFRSVEDVISRFRRSKADEVVLMAPLTMCRKILSFGVKPLYAEMKRTDAQSPELIKYHRDGSRPAYEFVRFKRMTGVEVIYEEV